jgi:hypothetical protein
MALMYPGEQVIDDDSPEIETPEGQSRGLTLEKRRTPYGHMYGAPPFPNELLIPRSEWQSRIAEMEERKSRISDIIVASKLPVKDQKSTNFCWIFAPTHCLEIVRVIQNQPMVSLSPASAGGPIKRFQNVGGWGEEGLQWIVDHGVCPSELWPDTSINSRLYTEENKAAALDYRVTEWWELVPRNLDQLVSCLLRRIPVAGGFNWWSHEVTLVDAVWLNGTVAIRIRNSWGDRSDWPNGFGILQGSKMLADDQVAPRVAVAS